MTADGRQLDLLSAAVPSKPAPGYEACMTSPVVAVSAPVDWKPVLNHPYLVFSGSDRVSDVVRKFWDRFGYAPLSMLMWKGMLWLEYRQR